MGKIGAKTVEAIVEILERNLTKELPGLNEGYALSDAKEGFPVTMKSIIKKEFDGSISTKTTISYVKEKVQLSGSSSVREDDESDTPLEAEIRKRTQEGMNNVHFIRPVITTCEDWFSGFDWLVGWGKDEDKYEIYPQGAGLIEYAELNRMRDDLEERMEIVTELVEARDHEIKTVYRKIMYGIDEVAPIRETEQPTHETNGPFPETKKNRTDKLADVQRRERAESKAVGK
jgi:hypothetical protein